MRQAGVLAAAGIFALENNIKRLREDHDKASEITETLRLKFGTEAITCHTNMIHLRVSSKTYCSLAHALKRNQVIVERPRWVLHKDISSLSVKKIKDVITNF